MSGLTISDLPPELLYTILSHYLADVLFDYLFLGALLPNHHNDTHEHEQQSNATATTTVEIRSIGRVSVAWRITLQRILGALLHSPNRYNEHGLIQSHHHHHKSRLPFRQLTMGIASSSSTFFIPTSTSTQFTTTQIPGATPTQITNTLTPTLDDDILSHYLHTLRTMQSALRDLVQHSIDMYRTEQDLLSLVNQPQTGVTTPTLLPVPIPIPIPPPPVQVQQVQVPHSTIPGAPGPGLPTVNGLHNVNTGNTNGNFNGNFNGNGNDHLLGALLSVAAPALKEYATTPLFQEALCYSQAAIFTCSSSNSFSCCGRGVQRTTTGPTATSNMTTTTFSSPSPFANTNTTTTGGIRIQRPDLSTLVLTTPRLVSALEWVRTREEEGYCRRRRICPREIGDVAECGMREVRVRIEDAIQVCRWNDLLNAVFLHGERSEEMIEALDGCFDKLEAKAGSIQMHHLLRSNLFKTIQTIARLGPISLVGHASPSSSSGILSSSPSQLSSSPSQSQLSSSPTLQGSTSCGEVWRSRAGALAFRWMGRVVEWTGL